MDTKTLLSILARTAAKAIAGAIVAHGWAQSSATEGIIGAIMLALSFGWSFWVQYGQPIILAELDILKAKVTNAAAAARVNPSGAPASLAKLDVAAGNKSTTTAGLVLLALIVGAGALIGSDARAASAASAASPSKSAAAPSIGFVNPIDSLMSQISSVKAEIVAGVVADLTAADADAAATNPGTGKINDEIAHACYPAVIKFLQSLPVASAPTGKFVLIQLFQKKRDFIAQVQAGLPSYLKLGCSALLGDELKTFVSIMGMIGVKILPAALTAMFPAIAPITLPVLSLTP